MTEAGWRRVQACSGTPGGDEYIKHSVASGKDAGPCWLPNLTWGFALCRTKWALAAGIAVSGQSPLKPRADVA